MTKNKKRREKRREKRRLASVDRGRRRFLGLITKGAAGFVLTAAAGGWIENRTEDQWDGVFGKAIPRAPSLSPEDLRAYRLGFINERIITLNGITFLSSGDLNVRLGEPETLPHLSHDRLALAPLRALRQVRDVEQEFITETARRFDSYICSGSPVANDLSGVYLPVVNLSDDPSTDSILAVSESEIPYHFATGYENAIRVVSGSAGGAPAWKRNNAILDVEAGNIVRNPLYAVDHEGYLANDYLILMRIPRNPFGGEILVVAGMHGPSTQALELLFDATAFPDSELRFIEETLADEPYWQIVFEVSNIVHAKPMSIARALRVSRLLRPKPIRPSSGFFVGGKISDVISTATQAS